MTDKNPSVAVIGAGTIGTGWAVRFAMRGLPTKVYDSAPGARQRFLEQFEGLCTTLEMIGVVDNANAAMDNCQFVEDLSEALSGSGLVQESIVEDASAKRQLFESMIPHMDSQCILASSTSALLPDEIFGGLAIEERSLVAHPFNPPYLMPLVEIVPATRTSEKTISWSMQFFRDLGQEPVRINKAVPGFAANRLQAAVVNEAMALVDEGVLSPEDADTCMTAGLGPRWACLGPFQTMDLNSPNGFAEYAGKFGDGYQGLGRDLKVAKPWSSSTLEQVASAMAVFRAGRNPDQLVQNRDSMIHEILAMVRQGQQ